jgi:Mce-associated membrane protein
VPPSRRHSRTTTPPVRRPRVAGLRRPNAAGSATTDHPEFVDDVEIDEAQELEDTEVLDQSEAAESHSPPVWREPAELAPPAVDEPVTGTAAPDTVEEDAPAGEAVERKPTPRPARPTGKRRTLGATQPADLAEAEAQVSRTDADPRRPLANPTLVRAIGLGVAVLILAALAIWFRGEANSQNADADNQALIDTARTSEVVGQVRDAIEKSLTYNYTDLESTAKAVQDNLAGKALCEYDQLFGQVRKLAPEQKLVLTTRVVQIGTTRLEGNRAELLVMVDQTTTRADQNQTAASGAQFAVRVERQGGKWKIIQFDMLGQPLPNGQALPQC